MVALAGKVRMDCAVGISNANEGQDLHVRARWASAQGMAADGGRDMHCDSSEAAPWLHAGPVARTDWARNSRAVTIRRPVPNQEGSAPFSRSYSIREIP
jgi:hypothetical protein